MLLIQISENYTCTSTTNNSADKMRILMFTWISIVVLLSNLFRIYVSGLCVLNEKTVLLQIRSELTNNSIHQAGASTSTKLVLWDERIDCCNWAGLSCNDATGYVTTLDLSDGGSIIHGSFNVSLLQKLPSLSVIRLDGINFSAPFPDFFEDFINLTVLSLVGCSFSGTVPQKVFQVPTLQTMNLSLNLMLEGSLPDFPENGSLQSLQLGITKFSGNLPESIGNLRLLSHIDLRSCNFSGAIPASIVKLTNLVELRLGGNHISGWIPSFKMFKNMTVVDLSYNNFTGEIPSSHWDGLDNLENLDLSKNSLSGPIPASLFFLPSLRTLSLYGNKFSDQMIDLQNVTSPLKFLDLRSNNLEGTIPSFFFQLQNLTSLSLSSNKFSVQMIDLQNVTSPLEVLDLSSNNLEWTIPLFFFQLQNLRSLYLSSNKFSGQIIDLQNVTSPLEFLDLRSNNLEGTIPSFFFQLQNLTSLDLSSNKFSGQMIDLQNVTSPLEIIDLSNNYLEGTIPLLFFHLQNLTSLSLSSNKFSGQMIDLQNVTSPLQSLILISNNLEGTIPSFFFHLQHLTLLYLSSNKFSGQMIDLQNVTSPLKFLDLRSNNLEGTIPSFFFQLQNLMSLDLSSNKFSGTVHLTKFRNPESIKSLDFSYNSLVIGTTIIASELPLLPQFEILRLDSCNLQKFRNFLKNQSKLQWLDLSSNAITGEIPNWIWGIGNGGFYYLNLSHNHLTHMKEPMEYGSLNYLDLNSNMLSGQIPRPPLEAKYLDFSNNNFSMIPLDIGDQIPYIFFFSIAKNKVSGRIPTSWCYASYLQVLDLSYNALHGTIPSCLVQNNSNLFVINLKGNHLSGEIPHKFLHNCTLQTLDLSQNLLKGKLPLSLVNCKELRVLNLGNNRINDTFPCWLNKLSNLHILVLHSNHFHGSISCPKLGVNNSWPSLQVIDLSSNNFSGNLPSDLFLGLKAILVERNIANSKVGYLHFTSPSPGILVYYQDSVLLSLKGQSYTIEKILSVFTSIDFSSNQFEGVIPDTVGELKLLYLLNLSHNALIGSIPPSLENLKALEALDLSVNSLTGNIPDQLESLTFLSFLNLSYNHLVGRIPQGKQFNTFGASSFMGSMGLCGFQLNVSCTAINEPASPLPRSEEKHSSYHADIYISVALGFVAGLGGIFVPLLLSRKWRSYYNKMIDEILSKIFFQGGQGRRRKSR